MKENINITASGDHLEIREGKALELREPTRVDISGTIDCVARFVKARVGTFHEKAAHILVNREQRTITLRVNETDFYGATVKGSLELHPDFIGFGINAGKARTNFEMAEFIKMNRTLFENQTEAMAFVSVLKNLRAKVDKEVELATDNRGNNKTSIINKVIESNVPEKFKLRMPIFRGGDKEDLEVEIYFNPSDITCTLVSPQANDILRSSIDAIIDNEIEQIEAVANDILIVEI